MLYFHWQRLVFLEVPKTGSSAVREVLAPLAAIDVNGPPRARHQNGPIFERITRRWLEQITQHKVETFAVMRDPVDRIRSWYRFLGRQEKHRHRIDGMSFEEFVDAVLAGESLTAAVGRQDIFFMGEGDTRLIQHIFRYDQPKHLHAFLSKRFERRFDFPHINVSPDVKGAEVTDTIRTKLHAARPREMALWQELCEKGWLGPQ